MGCNSEAASIAFPPLLIQIQLDTEDAESAWQHTAYANNSYRYELAFRRQSWRVKKKNVKRHTRAGSGLLEWACVGCSS